MKLERQHIIRIDGVNPMMVWTDIETGEERYEGSGQVMINVHGPQGAQVAPVGFQFVIEATTLAEAAVKFGDELQAAGQKAAREAVEKINANQRKIQVAGEDQIIHIGKDRLRLHDSH